MQGSTPNRPATPVEATLGAPSLHAESSTQRLAAHAQPTADGRWIHWDELPFACATTNGAGEIIQLNGLAVTFLRRLHARGICKCKTLAGCMTPVSRELFDLHLRALENQNTATSEPLEMVGSTGQSLWIVLQSRRVPVHRSDSESGHADKHGVILSHFIQEVTRQRLAEKALDRSHRAFDELISAIPDAVLRVCGDRICDWNRAFATLTKVENPRDLDGRPIGDFLRSLPHAGALPNGWATPAPHPQQVLLLVQGEAPVEITLWTLPITIDRRPQTLILLRPTEMIGTADEQAHAFRLATLGLLSAGVAHDINNSLNYLMLNIEAATDELSQSLQVHAQDDQPSLTAGKDFLQQAYLGAEHIRDIVRSIRSFSRHQRETQVHFDMTELIAKALTIVRPEFRGGVTLCVENHASATIWGYPGKITQVIVNLLLNAIQAVNELPHDAPRRVLVRTRVVQNNLHIDIQDNGPGIAPAHLSRIFAPFFTTKQDIGTGLGLYLCRRYAHEHRGEISAESEAGKGATFTLQLPTCEQHTAPLESPRSALISSNEHDTENSSELLLGRSILLIEDDAHIQRALRFAMHTSGLLVDPAPTLAEAKTLLAARSYDLIICDLQLRDASGQGLAQFLEEHCQQLRRQIVFLTSTTDAAPTNSFLAKYSNQVLTKPVSKQALVQAIGQCMGKDTAPISVPARRHGVS